MPWIVGIDEAGYGPNLGPFVMSAVALHVPESAPTADPWRLLRKAVRRPGQRADGRVLVGDSKLVYSPGRGVSLLELQVHAFLAAAWGGAPPRLRAYIERFCPGATVELSTELWYTGRSKLPVTKPARHYQQPAVRLAKVSGEQAIQWGPLRSIVICSARFNQLLEHWGSKAAILGLALADLLPHFFQLVPDTEGVLFFIDKHGGRNTYAAMLQQAVPDGMVMAHEESMDSSIYSILGLPRPMRFTFQPRADLEHFAVALASMASKYLRELLMREFNRYWQRQVPGLKATHGYPGDARRFYHAVRPAAEKLAIPETALWRQR
jgi:ribonuclease HII